MSDGSSQMLVSFCDVSADILWSLVVFEAFPFYESCGRDVAVRGENRNGGAVCCSNLCCRQFSSLAFCLRGDVYKCFFFGK